MKPCPSQLADEARVTLPFRRCGVHSSEFSFEGRRLGRFGDGEFAKRLDRAEAGESNA